MGHLRTTLAILVVSFHALFAGAGDTLPQFLPDGRSAVQLFYVISGFYMALILNRKYTGDPGSNWLFYSNRILRLWPPILAVNMLVFLKFMLLDRVILFNYDVSLESARDFMSNLDIHSKLYLAFTNVFVFGQDLLWFMRFDPESGVSFAPFGSDPEHNGSSYSLNHPLFTVAIEGWLYLLAPFFLRRGLRVALVAVSIGALYHFAIWSMGHYQIAWSYHFFFSAVYFFSMGAASFHLFLNDRNHMFRQWIDTHRTKTIVIIAIVLFFLLVIYPLLPLPRLFETIRGPMSAAFLAVIIPAVFILSSKSRYDRFVGELSFGVYLVHFPLLMLYRLLLPPEWLFRATLLSSIAAAILLYFLVEKPVDRWRQRRVRVS